MMRDLKWSTSEKAIARKSFDQDSREFHFVALPVRVARTVRSQLCMFGGCLASRS